MFFSMVLWLSMMAGWCMMASWSMMASWCVMASWYMMASWCVMAGWCMMTSWRMVANHCTMLAMVNNRLMREPSAMLDLGHMRGTVSAMVGSMVLGRSSMVAGVMSPVRGRSMVRAMMGTVMSSVVTVMTAGSVGEAIRHAERDQHNYHRLHGVAVVAVVLLTLRLPGVDCDAALNSQIYT